MDFPDPSKPFIDITKLNFSSSQEHLVLFPDTRTGHSLDESGNWVEDEQCEGGLTKRKKIREPNNVEHHLTSGKQGYRHNKKINSLFQLVKGPTVG